MLCLQPVQLYFAIALGINRSMLQYKLMNKWRAPETAWPDYSGSSSRARNSTSVSSSLVFTCLRSRRACFLMSLLLHILMVGYICQCCKFRETLSRGNAAEELASLPHSTCGGVREGRQVVFLKLHATATTLHANWSFSFGFSRDFGFVFASALEIRYRSCTEEC